MRPLSVWLMLGLGLSPLPGVTADDMEGASRAAEQRVLEVTARDLPSARGLKTERLSLVRWRDDGFEPVPFQIDELDEHDLVWFDGSGHERQGDPGVFDARDELMALFRDVGEKAPDEEQPGQGEILAELEVRNPAGESLYFYLARDHEPRSPVHYVEHNVETGVTRTPWYRLEVDPDNELNWNHLDYRGYEGEGSIIDTLKMRMSAGVLSRFTRMTLTNRNLDPELLGLKTGPIRSVMHLETRVVISGIPVMTMHVQALRYPAHYEAHTYAEIPFVYRATLKEPRVSVSMDGHEQYGARVKTARSGDLVGKVDGRMDEDERKMVERGLSTDEDWILFDSRKGFSLLTLLEVPEELSGIPLGLIYQDDEDKEVQPERHPGQLPNLGYEIRGWPPEDRMRFAVKLLFDESFHGLAPQRYAALRTDQGDWVRIHPRDPE